MDASKYNSLVAWRSLASNVYQLTRETTDPATYRVFVSNIDGNDAGAGEVEIGYYLTDYLGIPYLIISSGSGYMDVEDSFKTGQCPVSGKYAYIHKSAYKGYSLFLPSFCFQFLHPLAATNNNKYAMSILWQNDPNPLSIPFTSTKTPTISNYQSYQVIEGKTVNLAEDYGENPQLMMIIEQTVVQEQYYEKPPKRILVGGLLDQIIFTLPIAQTGRIIISK